MRSREQIRRKSKVAWDNDRPYIPVDKDGNMMRQSNVNPDKRDIDVIYQTGIATIHVQHVYGGKTYWDECRFEQMNDVRMSLLPVGTAQTQRSGYIGLWMMNVNTSKRYYINLDELDRILDEHLDKLADSGSFPIDGYWTAAKRGNNYTLRLLRLAGD